MVIGTIVAVSGTVMMKMNNNRMKAQTQVSQKQNLSRYINKIEANLFDYKSCGSVVAPSSSVQLGYTSANIGYNAPQAITPLDNKFVDGNGINIFEDDFYQFGLNENSADLNNYRALGWVISDIDARRFMLTSFSTVTYIDVTFLKTDQETLGANRVIKSFKIETDYAANNKTFIRCFNARKNAIKTAILNAKKELCSKDMLGYWGGSSCDYAKYQLEQSPEKSLTGKGSKSVSLGPISKYKACFLTAAGKTWSTKDRDNRAHRCYIEKAGSLWMLFAKESHSDYICKARCWKLKEL